MKFTISILIFLVLTTNLIVGQNQNYPELSSKIDSILIRNNFNGVVFLTKGSEQIVSKSIGYSNLEKKISLRFEDQFVIGSISKQITAVLVLREYEKGRINLNDLIDKYLTDINQPWSKEVTIHQLLTHTHGIVALDKPLEFKAGSQFQYSQLGFELLARILEKSTGKTFEKIATSLFKKYDLKNTFHPNNKKYSHLVKGYEENEKGVLEFTSKSLENFVAAGAFISNAEDLNKWNQLLYSQKLVKKETLELMKTRYATRIHPVFETIEYGYGLLFKDGEQNNQIGAFGYASGFVSALYFYPQVNMNLIVLENTAYNLNDFKKTFKIHTDIMNLLKKLKE